MIGYWLLCARSYATQLGWCASDRWKSQSLANSVISETESPSDKDLVIGWEWLTGTGSGSEIGTMIDRVWVSELNYCTTYLCTIIDGSISITISEWITESVTESVSQSLVSQWLTESPSQSLSESPSQSASHQLDSQPVWGWQSATDSDCECITAPLNDSWLKTSDLWVKTSYN